MGPDWCELNSTAGLATQIPGDNLRTVWTLAVPEPSANAAAIVALLRLATRAARRRAS